LKKPYRSGFGFRAPGFEFLGSGVWSSPAFCVLCPAFRLYRLPITDY
jgi:hypothetical protein